MRNRWRERMAGVRANAIALPSPTARFRRRAWLEFQKALDPLAPPKPLKLGRR